jgi:DNA polymerase-3 subunit alpha
MDSARPANGARAPAALPHSVRTNGETMPLAERLKHERELLGFYISGHPMNAYHGLDELLDTLTPATLPAARDRTPFRLGGVVTTVVKRISKRDNRPWATFSLDTRRGGFTVNVFADTYDRHQALLVEGNVVLVHGEVRHDEFRNEKRLNANEIAGLDERLPGLVRGVQWVLRPEPPADEFLRFLGELTHAPAGATAMMVSFWQGDGQVLQFDLPALPRLRLDPATYHRLRQHPAVHAIVADIAPPPTPEPRWPRNGS